MKTLLINEVVIAGVIDYNSPCMMDGVKASTHQLMMHLAKP